MKKVGNILWGLVFIVIGIIVGINALGIANINIFFNGWWTLFIIIPCFIGLFKDTEKTGCIIGVLIGIALLLGCQNIIDFDILWELMFPSILVIIGLSLIFKDTIHTKINHEIKKINKNQNESNDYTATFGSQNVNFNNEEFMGADLNAIFGGVKCDLRKAIIKKDVVINAGAIFGGIEIFVPDNVTVKIKSTPIFGGVSNKINNESKTKSPVIYVNSVAVFGGVEIK